MSDWLQQFNSGADLLETAAHLTNELWNDLNAVGHNHLAGRVEAIHHVVQLAQKQYKQGLNGKIDADLKRAQKNSAAVLNAVFAGWEKTKGEPVEVPDGIEGAV